MMKSISLTLYLLLISAVGWAQQVTINGYIKDDKSKEALIGATLYSPQTKSGTTSNEYGYYSFTMKASDTIDIVVSFVGYQPQAKRLFLKENTPLDIFLSQGKDLQEVTVSATRNDYNVSKAQVGIINVPMREIKNLPVLAGERDVLKVLQFLPDRKSVV